MPWSPESHVLSHLARHWWVFLMSGAAWLVVAVVVLRFDIASVATVGLVRELRRGS